jgi:hypothetical protein
MEFLKIEYRVIALRSSLRFSLRTFLAIFYLLLNLEQSTGDPCNT